MNSKDLVPLKADLTENNDPSPIQGKGLGIGRFWKIFGTADSEDKEKMTETENESIYSDDSGLNSSRHSDDTKIIECEIDLPKDIIQLAGDTWPLKESLLFRYFN